MATTPDIVTSQRRPGLWTEVRGRYCLVLATVLTLLASYLQLEQIVLGSTTDVCESVNSIVLNSFGLGSLPGCTLENEYDEMCLSLWMSLRTHFLCMASCPILHVQCALPDALDTVRRLLVSAWKTTLSWRLLAPKRLLLEDAFQNLPQSWTLSWYTSTHETNAMRSHATPERGRK